jgi:N-acetyl-alpha-D-muramate 1-phosphate uridylyltransferase
MKAMVLAAGLGLRMRPITETIPKALVHVGGCALVDHALDRLEEAGVAEAVVNAHYRAAQLEDHLATRMRPRVTISREDALLETGGGVRKALPLLGDAFFVVNSDVLWLNGRGSALGRLRAAFDAKTTDALLMLQRTTSAIGYDGHGDYFLDQLGVPRRRRAEQVAPFVFSGVQILARALFDGVDETRFSLTRLYDRAEAAGRLRAVVHDGLWFHIGTPDGLKEAEAALVATSGP